MSGTRDGFYFQFAEGTPEDYKTELNNILTIYDGFQNTKTYTPYAAGLVCVLITAVQAGLGHDPSYSVLFNMLLMLAAAAQMGIMAIANGGINNFAEKGNRLIDIGASSKFFKTAPETLPTVAAATSESTLLNIEQPNVHADALKYRLLGRNGQ
ncbi:MAG: hypothetical protein JO149_04150 [Gammaproteobacteria bacterium]|nr:hypothetical protein [Gammaproteobacteria bacterium]